MSNQNSFNYFVEEKPEMIGSRELIAEIVSFFAKQYKQKIILITRQKLTVDEALLMFGSLPESQRSLINFMYCKNYETVLKKLLELDYHSHSNTPKLIIIESLHQWYNSTTAMEKVPMMYSTIIAALQDLITVNSRLLKQACYSFVTADVSEFPRSIIDLFYGSGIVAEKNCLIPIFEKHKKPGQSLLQ